MKYNFLEDVVGEIGRLNEIKQSFIKYDSYIIEEMDIDISKENILNEKEYVSLLYNNPNTLLKNIPYIRNTLNKKSKSVEHIIGISDTKVKKISDPSDNSKSKPIYDYYRTTEDPELLFSIIGLVEEPINWNNLKDSFSKSKIIYWCEKHTLPVKEFKKDLFYFYNKVKFPIPKEADGISCFLNRLPLILFYYEAVVLYILYNLWRFHIYEDHNMIEKYLLLLIEPIKYHLYCKNSNVNLVEFLVNIDEISSEEGFQTTMSLYKLALVDIFVKEDISIFSKISYLVNMRLEKINNQLIFDKNKSKVMISLTSDNIFDICYHQLAVLMSKGEEGQKHAKNCPQCGALWWAEHGNAKYCNQCDRRTHFSRKKRSTKKSKN